MQGLALIGKRSYCNSPLLGDKVVEWWKGWVGCWVAAWVLPKANLVGGPTDGQPDLHFTGVGLVTLAQKYVKDLGLINDFEHLPLQYGQETADREGEHKVLGFFNNMRTRGISLGEVLGSGLKGNRRKYFFTSQFSCGALRHNLLQVEGFIGGFGKRWRRD